MHPILKDQFPLSGTNNSDVIAREHGETIAVNLAHWDARHQRIADMKRGRVSDLSVARRSLSAVIVDEADGIRKYLPIFCESMSKLCSGATRPLSTIFRTAPCRQDGKLSDAGSPRFEDRFVGASLFLHDHEFAHYHLSGTTTEGLRLKASTLPVNQAADWARTKGCRWLHLGGGSRANDGLYNFKASFGGTVLPYIYVTVVADNPSYKILSVRQLLSGRICRAE